MKKNKGVFSYSEKVLKVLRQRYKLGLITTAKKGIKERKKELESSGLLHYFDSVIIDKTKTSEHFLRCMKELGTTPKKTIIVDDRVVRGIKIGNKLGCITCWIQKGKYSHELPNKETGKPTYKINSVEELLKFFLKIQ